MSFLGPKGLNLKPVKTGNDFTDAILNLILPMTLEEQVTGLASPVSFLGMAGKKFLPGPKTLEQFLYQLGKSGEGLNPAKLLSAIRNPTTKEVATGGLGISNHPWTHVPPKFTERGFLPPGLPATSENFIPDKALEILMQPALLKQAFEQGTLDELLKQVFSIGGSGSKLIR